MSSAILRDFAGYVTIFVRNFRDFLASLCHRCGFILAHVIHVGETFFYSHNYISWQPQVDFISSRFLPFSHRQTSDCNYSKFALTKG